MDNKTFFKRQKQREREAQKALKDRRFGAPSGDLVKMALDKYNEKQKTKGQIEYEKENPPIKNF